MEEGVPEIRNTLELELLCKIYRSRLAFLSGNMEMATTSIKGSQKLLKNALADPSLFPASMSKTIQSQYLALIRSAKAEQAMFANQLPRAISLTMKNKEGLPIHASQAKGIAKDLTTGTNLTHPIHQYNNLGVIHLRMKKYSLALAYFQTVLLSHSLQQSL